MQSHRAVVGVERKRPGVSSVLAAGQAVSAFSTDLYQRIAAHHDGNLVCSPYSVATVLTMALAGAAGGTADQLRQVLRGDDRLVIGLGQLEQLLPAEVTTASSLWAQRGLHWQSAFLEMLASSFGTGVELADFRAAPEQARAAINAWVARRTEDRIPALLAPGTIGEDTSLVLANALHIATPWAQPFLPRSSAPRPFTRLDGSIVEALTMHGSAASPCATGSGWAAVDLACAGGLAVTFVLPDAGRFAEVERGIDARWLARLHSTLRPGRVHLGMPRWTTRTALDLTAVLCALGMPATFSVGADFSGMTVDEPLRASAVLHEAVVAVDEQGIKAASATAVLMPPGAALPAKPVEFIADRPFLYLVHEVQTRTPLFIGRLLDPS